MQNVRVLSSLTNELIHVTPSSAFRAMTPRQSSAPPLATGMCRPCGKVRCTRYRGISFLLFARPLGMARTYEPDGPTASGGRPILAPGVPYLGAGLDTFSPTNRRLAARPPTAWRLVRGSTGEAAQGERNASVPDAGAPRSRQDLRRETVDLT